MFKEKRVITIDEAVKTGILVQNRQVCELTSLAI